MFGPEYCKIQTAFKRDSRGVIIPGEWTLPELGYLAGNQWRWTEKVDGTNIRLHWNQAGVTVGGRTDSAQVPATLISALQDGYLLSPVPWKSIFPDCPATVYGEGYGARIQKGGGNYRDDQGVIVFDVRVGDWWLKDDDVAEVASKLGLELVPSYGTFSLVDAWNKITRGELRSRWPKVSIEGLVGRPSVDLFCRNGDRLIVKLKIRDYADYARRGSG